MLPIPTVPCEFLNSDAVFVGKVSSVTVAPPRGDEYDGWLYDLTVQELFRGPQTKIIQVFTENSSGRFQLDTGKQYLIFAYDYKGRLEIDNCGNSSEFPAVRPILRTLRRVRIPKDAVIEGNLVTSDHPDTAAGGVRIVVRSRTRTFFAVSNHDGWFHLRVPAGTYSAKVEKTSNLTFAPFGLTEDPSHFEAHDGRCVGLRFMVETQRLKTQAPG
jgi:hypothetical protein